MDVVIGQPDARVRVDWIWNVGVERVLVGPPDLLGWAAS